MIIALTAEEALYLDDQTTLLGERHEIQVGIDLKLRLGSAFLASLTEGSVPVDFDESEILSLLQATKGTDARGNEQVGLSLKKKLYAILLEMPLPEGTPQIGTMEEENYASRDSNTDTPDNNSQD